MLAFAFLVTLFVGPVQMGTQILTDAQNAIAGWRRVIGILDTPADLVDPGPGRRRSLPRGPIDVDASTASASPTPAARRCCATSTLTIDAGTRVAIVGETGSGKSTFAKLLTRLMDPTEGAVLLDGVDVRDIGQASACGRSVVLVPQEGFLFDDTLAANVRYGRLDATEDEILASADELGPRRLGRRPAARPRHPGRPARRVAVGGRAAAGRAAPGPPRRPRPAGARRGDQRGRPALEMRIGRALERLMRGRTSVTIAHRMSTAEDADEVVVVDRGRIVQRGPHAELVGQGGVYAGLHASWVAQQG